MSRTRQPRLRVVVVGAGYVGLVTAAGLARFGVDVALVDVDADRIDRLTRGESVLHEPGLDELLAEAVGGRRLRFGTRLTEALPGADAVFIAVPTPMSPTGAADLRFVHAVVDEIGQTVCDPLVVVTKSTVPVGTGDGIAERLEAALRRRRVQVAVHVAANPEFLREGSAVHDVLHPDRIVVGTSGPEASGLLRRIYRPLTDAGVELLEMDRRSAELGKYAANAMLAARISMMNQFAALCAASGADIEAIRATVGADARIGSAFLRAGLGFGGSCFPKDVAALVHTGADLGVDTPILSAVLSVNDGQRHLAARILAEHLPLAGARVAVWGLAFKPDTDDVRESAAVVVIRDLLAAGARVTVHDPAALANLPADLVGRVRRTPSALRAATGADAVVLATEWAEYAGIEPATLAAVMHGRLVLDGRNVLPAAALAGAGLTVLQIGRPSTTADTARISAA